MEKVVMEAKFIDMESFCPECGCHIPWGRKELVMECNCGKTWTSFGPAPAWTVEDCKKQECSNSEGEIDSQSDG